MVDLKISIPVKAAAVKRGTVVAKGDVLAKTPAQKIKKEFDLAKILRVKPLAVRSFLKFVLGQEVSKNDLIAEKKSLLGKTVVFKTPFAGILKSLSADGELVIEQTGKQEVLKSPVNGQVFALDKNEIVLKIKGIEIAARRSFGQGLVVGILMVLTQKGERLDFAKLSTDLSGKIVVGSGPLSPAVLIKADTLGIAGIVIDDDGDKKMQLYQTPVLLLGKELEALRKYHRREAVMDLDEKRIIISG